MSEEMIPNNYVDEDGIKWTKSRCFFCHSHCSMLIGSKDGKIITMKPNESDYFNGMCERIGETGERAIKHHYHPKRINHVLKRVGERGENKWEKIPYEQALDEVAEKLTQLKEKFGPETLTAIEGTYRSDHLWARSRFSNLWGNPGNIADPGTICWCWLYAVNMAMCGFTCETSLNATIDQAKTIVIWGTRLTERYSPKSWITRTLRAAYEKPVDRPNLIVIDPVMIDPVRHADHFLQLRPGTDLAMMLGWLNVIFTEKLYDEEFLKQWSNGPFLIRMDTKKMLRETDLDRDGDSTNFVSWNSNTESPAIWLSAQNKYRDNSNAVDDDDDNEEDFVETKSGKRVRSKKSKGEKRPHVTSPLEGEYRVTLADGNTVTCKTAFTLLKERIDEYPVEKVAEITTVPADKIQKAARMYATQGPSTLGWGVGAIDQQGWNATYGGMAKLLIRGVTGNLDILGGDYVPEPGPLINGKFPVRDCELELSHTVSPEARKKLLGNDRYRLMGWPGFEKIDKTYREMWGIPRPQVHQLLSTAPVVWRAMLEDDPYPVKAAICWSSNPMVWAPNTKLVYKALKSLDLLVVLEYWMTPTAALADYVFPAADWMERPMCSTIEDSADLFLGGGRAVPPVGDRRMDYDFFRALGMRLGQENDWPWETYEEVIAHRLERVGVSYDEFCETGILFPDMRLEKHKEVREDGQVRGYATPSRKLEIYPSIFEELDYDPLPSYRELPETPVSDPDLAKEYPIILTTGGRWSPMFHSEHRVPGIGTREMFPWPIFQIHLETARDLGIRDGDWCWIESPRGRVRQRARLGFDIAPGTIIAQPSWWYPERPVEEPWLCGAFESNINVLTDDDPDNLDPMCGNWVNRGLMCKVYRCEEPEWLADRIPSNLFVEGKSGFPGV